MTDSTSSVLFELHRASRRTRPGHNTCTKKAFDLLPRLREAPSILDIGCGAGAQTLELVRLSGGTVTAIDKNDAQLEELRNEGERLGLSERLRTLLGPIDTSSLNEGEFDLVWSEGGVQSLGLVNALESWRTRLAIGGSLVFSDLNWLKSPPPPELASFLRSTYPEMISVDETLEEFDRHGLDLISFFVASETAWWDEYFAPLEKRIFELQLRYPDDHAVSSMLQSEKRKIDFRRKFPDCYGLVFYVARPYAH